MRFVLLPLVSSLALLLSAAVQAAPAAPSAPIVCPPVAKAPTAEQVREAQAKATDRGAIWRLSKDGVTSYLYGTVHIGKLEWLFPGPKLMQALRETQVLAIELDVTDPGFQAELMKAQAEAAPLTLTADEQARLDAQADAACIPRGALAAMHPIMQAVTYMSLAGRHDGLDPGFGQEMALVGAAKAQQRPVVALESVGLQMQVLLPKDPLVARRLLRSTLDSLEGPDTRTTLKRLSEAWLKGDLKPLSSPAELCQCKPSAEELAFQAALNDDRNPGLATRIAAEHAKGKPVLAAVGLLHMTGPKALPKLLGEQGFAVERLR